MHVFQGDIHIHTVLSPCGDVEMSPVNIIEKAVIEGLDIIGITDHNTTKHCELIQKLGEKNDIFVLPGAEVNTKEEIHCLAFFESIDILNDFQLYLESHLIKIENDPQKFGYQPVVNEFDDVLREEKYLLISSLDQTIDQVEQKVNKLGGIFIPAHIDRLRYSLTSQLGFVPAGMKADAFEISPYTTKAQMIAKYKHLKEYSFIRSSDAHFIDQVGMNTTGFKMDDKCYKEIKMALNSQNGRQVIIDEINEDI